MPDLVMTVTVTAEAEVTKAADIAAQLEETDADATSEDDR
jgi:hypothetical protein